MKLHLKRFLILFLLAGFIFPGKALAVENPTAVTNNSFGVHILNPGDIDKAAPLVNGNGGDWGYVTIPIQINDRDVTKWQSFFDKAKELHIIPIMRLVTEGASNSPGNWRPPDYTDILDFATFLNSLSWPTKNRYIIAFNEPNRTHEWQSGVDPASYADILNKTINAFKFESPDFFIISAGMDNAAVDVPRVSMNEYEFYQHMNQTVPGIFTKIDGMSSHSYPNPGFYQSPATDGTEGTASFKAEKQLLVSMGANPNLPVFITETGWDRTALNDNTIVSYFQAAFTTIWNSPDVVAVTPFILYNTDMFPQFSLLHADYSPTPEYTTIENMPKVKGTPVLDPSPSPVLAAAISPSPTPNPVIKKVVKIPQPPTIIKTVKVLLVDKIFNLVDRFSI